MNDDITAVLDSGGLDPPENEHTLLPSAVISGGSNPPDELLLQFQREKATLNDIVRTITMDFIEKYRTAHIDPRITERILIALINDEIGLANRFREKTERLKKIQVLPDTVIADLLVQFDGIVNIVLTSEDRKDSYLFGGYVDSGDDTGIYRTDEDFLDTKISSYNYLADDKNFKKVRALLKGRAPRVHVCRDRDLIPVNNGIFNYKTKALTPFDPKYIFTTKCRVDYNVGAQSPNIYNPNDGTYWNVDDWITEIADDAEIAKLIWELLGACVRPNVKWDKAAFMMSSAGCNGKGTLCVLMRALVGKSNCVSLQLSDYGKDFLLEPLIRASAIITDENDVGGFVEKGLGNIKATITQDEIMVNRKFRIPIMLEFHGMTIQCLNDLPRIKDKSESFFRRQLYIPFSKSFTGKERKYIKEDYVQRKDVLEYVLYKVLNTNYYVLSEPDSCKFAKEEYKEFNDPIRQFVNDILPQCKWKLLPYDFLYDLYKSWKKEKNPSGSIEGYKTFNNNLRTILHEKGGWSMPNYAVSSKGKMDDCEPLIYHYQLEKWYNPLYHGSDPDKLCYPALNREYRGITRN